MAYTNFKKRFSKKRVSFIYVFYWLMLAYMVAALVFWYISLTSQNAEIHNLKRLALPVNDPAYQSLLQKINGEEKIKSFQYTGEGVTFLILIITSAIFVFRMLRVQLKLSKQQRDFMMAITHELKTPIAVTKLNLETMIRRQLEPTQQQRLINATLNEADRLNALCNNMLLLNEMGSGYTVANEDIFLDDLIAECLNEHKNRYQQREFVIQTETGMHIYGDRVLLKLAINNLLDNAVKYSPKTSAITVNTFTDGHVNYIRIIDEGDGIPENEVKKVFQKYYRGATRQAKGTGLGLYVTRQIIRQSRGRLTYSPNHPKGSIFTISFAV